MDDVARIGAVDLNAAEVGIDRVISAGDIDAIAAIAHDRGSTANNRDGNIGREIHHVPGLHMDGV